MLQCKNPFGERSIITGVTRLLKARPNKQDAKLRSRAIPTNYRQPGEVWPTSIGDDNALMISPMKTLAFAKKSGKVSTTAGKGGEGDRVAEHAGRKMFR